MMKGLIMLAMAMVFGHAAAQQFWSQGACWIYSWGLNQDAQRRHHLSDTLVDGVVVQKIHSELGYLDQDGVFHIPIIAPAWNFYTKWQNDLLWVGYPPFTSWDTLYRLGVPGDRWWPGGSEEFCDGYSGMLQILDTGHVVLQGVSLRTWDVTGLTQSGSVMPIAFETITERLGLQNSLLCPVICSWINDCWPAPLYRYSDGEINIPQDATCGLIMGTAPDRSLGTVEVAPNPGTDQLRISGLSDLGARIEVHDALGRSVAERSFMRSEEFIGTADWEPGTYFITVVARDGSRQVLRWVKQ